MQKNIYILALEYGSIHMENGITYNEMLAYLEKNGIKPKNEFENYFHVWFYKNFWVESLSFLLNNSPYPINEKEERLVGYDDKKAVLTALAYSELLDYQKLQQAREDSKKAHKLALIAIWISIGLGLLQILIDLLSSK